MYSQYINEELIRRVTSGLVDLQARDYRGQTVLHFAVSTGRIQLLETLLENGADVNVVDDQGMTPLLMAVTTSQAVELLPLLMKHGADVFARASLGNAFHYLTYNPYGETHLDLAYLVRVFVEKGVPLDATAEVDEFQPLHVAVALQKNVLVKLFLDHGANMNARTRNGNHPLYFAAGSKNPGALKILLTRGAVIDLRTNNGRTALHKACKMFDEDNVRLLLFAGADVLAEDHKGKTPFALIRDNNARKPRFKLMIRALALRKACLQPTIELKDERLMKEHPDKTLWNYYQDCHASISRMKATRIIERCTFFELLTKSHDQIATLMRNPDFESNFVLHDLNEFSVYAEDVRGAYERAQHQYYFMLEREDTINEAVYHALPDIVVRRVIRYLWDCFEKHAVFDYIFPDD